MQSVVQCVNMSLWEVYIQTKQGNWILPEWQRSLVWKEKYIQEWENDIKRGGHMPGVLVTFSLQNETTLQNETAKYLNDGEQRRKSTVLAVENMKKNGKTMEEITAILSKVYVTVQHMVHKSMEEAFSNFFRLNLGTTTTPYELGKGIFSLNLNDFNIVWQPFLNQLHNLVDNKVIARLGCKLKDNRNTRHKQQRSDYALFLQYLSGNKNFDVHGSNRESLNLEDVDEERKLADLLVK